MDKFIKWIVELFGCRHIFALMGFLGLASVYAMRINMSVAIVDMVKQSHRSASTSFFSSGSADNSSDSCPDNGDGGGDDGVSVYILIYYSLGGLIL